MQPEVMLCFISEHELTYWKHSCSLALLQYVFAISVTIATHTDNLWLDAIEFVPILEAVKGHCGKSTKYNAG